VIVVIFVVNINFNLKTKQMKNSAVMKKTFIFLATLLLVFSGCHNEDDVSGEKQEIKEIVLSEEEKEITEKYTDFAFHLFNQVNLSEKVNNNWIISPYSASLVLSTLANGAEGNTLAEIKSVLGINEFAMNEVNLYYRKLSLALPKLDDIVYLPLLNSIWVNKDVQLHLSFVNACGQYGTEINSLDLRNSNAVNTINDWFVLHTQNRDMRVVDEVPTNTEMLLASVFVFKSNWKNNFVDFTEKGVFTNEDGTQAQVKMMNPQLYEALYTSNEYFSIAEFPYGNEAFSMVILLPNEGKTLSESVSNLTASNWMMWNEAMKEELLQVLLPCFSLDYKKDLGADLLAMGVKDAFNSERADFSGISESSLFLSSFFQAYHLKVDEKSTVSESVTINEMSRYSEPRPSVPFLVNRPFAFLIKENSTGLILFAGKISEL
jgi:serpin B